MATDLSILIFDPQLGAVVCDRWLGGNSTLEAARGILARGPSCLEPGLECWTNVLPNEVEQVADSSYEGGGTPAEIAALAERFPARRYAWMLLRDY